MTRIFLAVVLMATPAFAQTPLLSPASKAEYDSKHVTVGDAVVVTVDGDSTTVTNTYDLSQGKYRGKLDEDAFFDLAGRPDLSKWYRDRQHLRTGLFVGGLAAVAGGVVAAATTWGCDVRSANDCVTPEKTILPLALIGGGGLLELVAASLNPHPPKPPQMRRLADQYNQGLLQSLSRPQPPSESSSNLGATPFVADGGGGVLLSGTF